MEKEVIAVDMQDNPLYRISKQKVHEEGVLHRAFSVIIVSKKKILLQKRAKTKYHCGGLWSNACCSHPYWGESVIEAAKRRIREELNIEDINIKEIGQIIYFASFDNGLKEFEYDHIFIGEYDDKKKILFDSNEIEQITWIEREELAEKLKNTPSSYTPWFISIYTYIDRFFLNGELENEFIKV